MMNALGRRRGFTLIELLISMILMIILLSAVTLIFVKTTDTISTSEARMQVYDNARRALDTFGNDLMSCLPFVMVPPAGQPQTQPAIQAFWMENGILQAPGTFPNTGPTVTGGHDGKAADVISFRCVAAVADTMQVAEVTYELIPGDRAVAPPPSTAKWGFAATVAGDKEHRQTVRTKRGLYTLVRRVRVADPADVKNPPDFKLLPKDKTGQDIEDTELCHYVISFNLEYYANDQNFSQLDTVTGGGGGTSPFPSSEPLGDGKGTNDTPGITAIRIPCIRATLVIVEDVAERQERTVQKTLWIPMG